MASDINKTVQQVIGYTNLLGISRLLDKKKTADVFQEDYKNFSDSVRVGIRKHGIQKTNMAHITFDPPPVFKTQAKVSGSLQAAMMATYRADSFAQPGISMATTEIKRYGVGPIERKPYLPIFTDQQFSFINDTDGLVHKFFYLWMNAIAGYDELPRGNAEKDIFGKLPFEVEYKDNYKTIINIYIYNENQNKVGVVQLMDAYPLFVGDISRSWGDQSSFVKFPVTFTFSHWKYEDLPESLDPQESRSRAWAPRNLQLSQQIMYAATAIQAITSIKRPQNVNDILNVVNTGSTLLRSIFPPSVEPTYTDYYKNRQGPV